MYPARVLTRGESDADVGALVDQWESVGFGHWVVELKETGQMIGRTGAKRHADWHLDPDNSEVGWLYAREAWGKGYATEGAGAAVKFLFEEIGRSEVISIADPGNRPSHRVMEKAGLSFAGRRHWGERGIDCVWYARRNPMTGDRGPLSCTRNRLC